MFTTATVGAIDMCGNGTKPDSTEFLVRLALAYASVGKMSLQRVKTVFPELGVFVVSWCLTVKGIVEKFQLFVREI